MAHLRCLYSFLMLGFPRFDTQFFDGSIVALRQRDETKS